MTQKLVWYTIRASGMVTWLLVTASVLWGLLLASRSTRRPRPAWVLDLHRFIAGLAFAFLAVHVGLLLADSYVGFSAAALAVPFASHWRPAAVAWGILALYLLVAVEVTSLLMAKISRRLWHAIHLGSFVVFGAATMHGITAGTDAGNPVSRIFAFGSIAAVALLTVLRVVARARRRRVAQVAARRARPTCSRPLRCRRLRCARSRTRSRRSGVEQLAVAVWRAAGTTAEDFRAALVDEWSAIALEREGVLDLTVNFALADQGVYTRTPDSDGLTSTVDGFVMLGLEQAHDLDDVPGRDDLYRLARRVDVWRVWSERPKSYERTWPDGTEAPGVKLVSFIRRAEGMNHEQFVRHWTESHTPLALAHHVGLWNYTQHVVRRAYTPGGRDVDGIAELHFATRDDFETRFFDSEEGRQVIMDDVVVFMSRPGAGSGLMTELPVLTVASP